MGCQLKIVYLTILFCTIGAASGPVKASGIIEFSISRQSPVSPPSAIELRCGSSACNIRQMLGGLVVEQVDVARSRIIPLLDGIEKDLGGPESVQSSKAAGLAATMSDVPVLSARLKYKGKEIVFSNIVAGSEAAAAAVFRVESALQMMFE